ncbi:MAG TPA: hypothetical protein VI408_13035 [Gaiellaceae bacterium]
MKAGSLLAVLAVALVAATAALAAAPAGTPDPATIVLTAADFPGLAKDKAAKNQPTGGTIIADRENDIAFTKPYGASRFVELDSEAAIERDVAAAGGDYAKLAKTFSSKTFRTGLAKELAGAAKVKPTTVRVVTVRPHGLGVGDSSMEVGYVVSVKKASLNFSISIVRLDRAIVLNIAFGLSKKVVAADAIAFARLAVAHATAALVPIAIAVPTVTGTPQQGQTLTATPGTWGDTPTGYAYQWQSCDPTGATCTDIAAATAATYVVQPTDVGRTLRVDVTATNRFGSVPATSAVTAPAG